MMEFWILAAALLVDVLFAEPRNAFHPVAWMGSVIARVRDICPSPKPTVELIWGGLMAFGVPVLFASAAYFLLRMVANSAVLSFALAVLFLKSTFALRALGQAAMSVRQALVNRELAAARVRLGSLCSREASELCEEELVAATIESVAENSSDSFVAPLFYFALFGVPGAVFYRAVNTLDAMIGYHGRFEYLGKVSARLDDALNFIPARLTTAFLLLAGLLLKLDVRAGLRVLLRDARRTESPNAGRPMAVMAGLLRVQLAKPGCYSLGDSFVVLNVGLIDCAWRTVQVAGFVTWGAVSGALWVSHG